MYIILLFIFSNKVVRLISHDAMIFTILDGGSNFREQQRLIISVMGHNIFNNKFNAGARCLRGYKATRLTSWLPMRLL